jgi:hypothetical protein
MRAKNLLLSCAVVVCFLFLCEPVRAADPIDPADPGFADFSNSNTVSIVLGADEISLGLKHINRVGDGVSVVEDMNGVSARKATLKGNSEWVYFYFALDPTFKSQDVRRVKIEVDYFDPAPGAMGIHYDSLDAEGGPGSKYVDATRPVALSGSSHWQKAVFHTRNDGGFKNRQNSQADFRIWGTTPTLYVGRVTVTRDPLNENWNTDFSKSNRVSIALGQENATDGLRHLTEESDGQTVSTNLNGQPCCYLDRTREGRPYGSFYFQISPSFKRSGLKNARVEVEYLSRVATGFRLQYDGMEGGARARYLPVLAEGVAAMRYPTGADYGRISNGGTWETAAFHLTNTVFQNSQKGDADFRIEVVPPEIYIRRVTVIRE